MTSTTLDIFNLLIDAGIEKSKAEPLAKEILTRSDAASFATKADISDVKVEIASVRTEMYRVAILQSGFIVTAVGLMLAFFR